MVRILPNLHQQGILRARGGGRAISSGALGRWVTTDCYIEVRAKVVAV
ncbi:hypothetical protein [Merismopedia glauca]|nr:hypothetical protein [Merismopedia glauca]